MAVLQLSLHPVVAMVTRTQIPSLSSSELSENIGAIFLGVVFAALLYGVNCGQIYSYCTVYWNTDNLRLRAFVISMWYAKSGVSCYTQISQKKSDRILGTLHLVFEIVYVYRMMVEQIRQPDNVVHNYDAFWESASGHSIQRIILQSLAMPVFEGESTVPLTQDRPLVKLRSLVLSRNYAAKIWTLSGHNRILLGICLILSAANMGIFISLPFVVPLGVLYVGFSTTIVADAFLAATMCTLLWRMHIRATGDRSVSISQIGACVYRIAFMGSLNWRNTLKQQQDADSPTVLSAIAFSTSPIRASFVPRHDYPSPVLLSDSKVVLDISKRYSEVQHLNTSESHGHGTWSSQSS
ncbi:hypothetical protein EVG20_g8049 [Dentipellis fragilis]|uniref:Uncharacterized protein n=1 Tax=Dentipellis fragilis TaxID=205917 RepID=A0A4Y9YAE4_9AGAM|nr:hypothetical protein EVG20_g8049 [Dentipellis fragilis]